MKTMTVHDYIGLTLRRRWVILLPILCCAAAATTLALTLPKAYRSSTLILVEPQKVPEEYVKPTVSSIEERLSTIRQQLFSRSLLQRIIDEYQLYQDKTSKMTNEEVIEMMRRRITVDTVKGKNVDAFTISFVGGDPTTTMNVTNKLASLFIEENLKIREQLVEGTSDFLDVELARLKERLEAQEQSLSNYKQRFMGSLPSQMEANLRTLDRLQLQLQAVTALLRETMDRKLLMMEQLQTANLDAALSTLPDGFAGDPRVVQLQALRRRLASLQSEYTDSYPDIQITKQEIRRLELELTIDMQLAAPDKTAPGPSGSAASSGPTGPTIDQEIARLQQQQQALQQQIQLYEKRVEETPKREQELASLTRDYETTKKSYDILLSKAGNAKISENLEKRQQGEQFRIMDPANLPERPFKPNPIKLLAIGLILGLGIGGGLALMLENLDTSIKRSDELEEAFGIQVLGVIPQTPSLRKFGAFNGAAAGALLSKETRS